MRILVGEPDETTRRNITNVLQRAGHVVTGRDCALRVLRTLQERRFDLVLLDCDLPGMAYHELLNLLPTLNSGTRTVLMGNWESGAAAEFLPKPFCTADLLAITGVDPARERTLQTG